MSYNPNATAATPQIFQAIDNITGLPLAGGQLFTYASGTITPQAAYTDNTLTIPLPNPIILDNYGQAVIWLGPNPYRFNLLNAAGVQQAHYPQDNIQPQNFTSFTTQLAASATPAQGQGLVGFNPALTYAAGTFPAALASTAAGQGDSLLGVLAPKLGAVPRTQDKKNQDILSVLDYGAIGDGVSRQLSTVTAFGSNNTTGWTLVQWQTIFPGATALSEELDGLCIQNALNACTTGGKVILPNTGGVYWTTDSLYPKTNTTMEWQGTFVKLAPGSNTSNGAVIACTNTGAQITLLNPLVDGNNVFSGGTGQNGVGAGGAGMLIQIFGGTIQNCARGTGGSGFDGNGGKGIQIESFCTQAVIDGTFVQNCGIAYNTDIPAGANTAPNVCFNNVSAFNCQVAFKVYQANNADFTGIQQSVRLSSFNFINCGSYQGVMQFSRAANVKVSHGQVFNATSYNSGSVDCIFRGRAIDSTFFDININAVVATAIINLVPPTDTEDHTYATYNSSWKQIYFMGSTAAPLVIGSATATSPGFVTNCDFDIYLATAPTGITDTYTVSGSSLTSWGKFTLLAGSTAFGVPSSNATVIQGDIQAIFNNHNTFAAGLVGLRGLSAGSSASASSVGMWLDDFQGNLNVNYPTLAPNGKGVICIGTVATAPSGVQAGLGRLYVDSSGNLIYLSPAGNARTIGPV